MTTSQNKIVHHYALYPLKWNIRRGQFIQLALCLFMINKCCPFVGGLRVNYCTGQLWNLLRHLTATFHMAFDWLTAQSAASEELRLKWSSMSNEFNSVINYQRDPLSHNQSCFLSGAVCISVSCSDWSSANGRDSHPIKWNRDGQSGHQPDTKWGRRQQASTTVSSNYIDNPPHPLTKMIQIGMQEIL